ncbi:MAG: enoyl-CoA hydratase-related protein [Dehalococcoidia bacterium]|nr:enoyl-CoA hydratase-related protein [Dehalococcoidia bacterium]
MPDQFDKLSEGVRSPSDTTGFKNIIYEKKGRLAYVTLNREERRNAIDGATSQELLDAFTDFKSDDEVWVAILTGAGDVAFSAGADLVAMAEAFRGGQGMRFEVPFAGITRGYECWKPMVAAINGYCLAGGLELALCCDIRIAAEHATFGLPEPKRAIIPGAGGTQRLPRAVPLAFAMELMLTGERFDAQTALNFGLVSRVVPADQLMPTVEGIAAKVLECGPLAVRSVKQAVIRGRDMTLEEGLKLESELAGKIFASEDAREGPTAFAQKRKPEYKGK